MTLTRAVRAGGLALLVLLLALSFLVGNQRQAYAQERGSRDDVRNAAIDLNELGNLGHIIICEKVFPSLNAAGPPVPHFDTTCVPPPPPPPPSSGGQCSDGQDNDGDGFTDANDPNCHTDGDPTNTSSYDPTRSESGSLPACWNGVDDDGDGKTDWPNDPGCSSATDTDEADGSNGGGTVPQCSNNLDDDGDGLTDEDDPGCSDPADNDETDSSDGEGSTISTGGSGPSGTSGGGGPPVGLITGPIGAPTVPGGIVLGVSTTTESCERYLTAFIRTGRDNDVNQVKRLQRFLRDYEGATGVTETGVYDGATIAAVHAFQTKYAADILTPWGIRESTGYVYLTTRKKVNEIVCRNTKTFPLTEDELKIILQSLESRVGTGQPSVTPSGTTPSAPSPSPSAVTPPASGAGSMISPSPTPPTQVGAVNAADPGEGRMCTVLERTFNLLNKVFNCAP